MKKILKSIGLIIFGMLLWSAIWHTYWFAMENWPAAAPEQKTGCEYMVTCGA